ncbi:hypothetical protein Bca52824_029736 [Brassica carinata]|uniref:peptidylprolyl isomerase n=1 Tax=Brassica carinata TaxID=52824 RepID=A0A8X7S6Z9_BRACI|nr:hypothetical protein Bca52824_029736 [Brassica carinata]
MGVEKQIIRPGTGPKPAPGQTVTVHCTGFGRLPKPFSFQIGKGAVIKGWDEGVIGMQIGEVARLRCSPDYAYGAGRFPAWESSQTQFLTLKSKYSACSDDLSTSKKCLSVNLLSGGSN